MHLEGNGIPCYYRIDSVDGVNEKGQLQAHYHVRLSCHLQECNSQRPLCNQFSVQRNHIHLSIIFSQSEPAADLPRLVDLRRRVDLARLPTIYKPLPLLDQTPSFPLHSTLPTKGKDRPTLGPLFIKGSRLVGPGSRCQGRILPKSWVGGLPSKGSQRGTSHKRRSLGDLYNPLSVPLCNISSISEPMIYPSSY